MNIENMLAQTDFRVEDTGREYRIYPLTRIARAITQTYKGVIMRSFAVTYGNFNSFRDWADSKTVLTWAEEV